MDEERRAEIKAMLAAITQGEWFWNDTANLNRLMSYSPDRETGDLVAILAHDNESYVGEMTQANLDFIARAPSIVRELLAELENIT